jgi:hypothetical protein
MVYRRLAVLVSVTCALGSTLLACGSDSGSMFGDGNGKSGVDNSGADPEGSFEDPLGPNGLFGACATSSTDTRLTPANLVVMYDKSGSMGNLKDDPSFDPNKRWIPISTGMKDFFADPRSSTMNASLQFFPLGGSESSAPEAQIEAACGYDYANPRVRLTSLTKSQAFVMAIDTTQPSGGTPTLPALRGAIRYAKTVATDHPGDKTAVVLVTDGEPGMIVPPSNNFGPGCNGNTIDNVAAEARAAYQGSPSIATYVIGIGDLQNLNNVAVAGGTKRAFIIDANNPATTKDVFQTALEDIRAKNLTCDFAMPSPGKDQKINPKSFNVVYQRANNKYDILAYNQDCTDGRGWKYDNAETPTTVTLCEATCKQVQSDNGGKLKLAFGCATEKSQLK